MSRWKSLKEALFGAPVKEPSTELKTTNVAVLGAVEQSYGIYQVPSFREQVTTFWDDPLLKEAITMFAEQVVATGIFLTSNPEYKIILNDKSALDVINEWRDVNNIDTKLLEIAIELKAYGNSLWRLDKNFGFTKVPIESVWHAIRIAPDIPLQEKYNMQLVPIYGAKVIPWGEFIHFRVAITGYHAPFGQGVVYSLLAKPVDSMGNVAPSVYDIRLSTRRSLNEGFRKFSFGNELWVFEGMSNEDFEASGIGAKIAEMSSTGNRIATNARGDIKLAVPERTQSYDEFIKQMRDEFFMALADPSLKLGLEEGFTKATSVTASEVYKYKIATMRKCIKEHFEDLFEQILSKLGYDGKKAAVRINFGPEETPIYAVKDIFDATKTGIILKNEARKLLATYHKWDIQGDIKGGDELLQAPVSLLPTRTHPSPAGTVPELETSSTVKAKGEELELVKPVAKQEGMEEPRVVVTELKDALGGYNAKGDIYVDKLTISEGYPRELIVLHEKIEYPLVIIGIPYEKAHTIANEAEHAKAIELGMKWDELEKLYRSILGKIKARGSTDPDDLLRASEGMKTAKELREAKRAELDIRLKEEKLKVIKEALGEKDEDI